MRDDAINMKSDTVTKPSSGMRQAIATAEVGDDMNGEDPTVNRLEAMMAEILGKEAAVFACSGTQSNQMGVRTHCVPGDELLISELGHIASFEAGGPAVLSGVTCRWVPSRHGMIDVGDLHGKIRADDQHLCRTRLVCVENTTNAGGGRSYPIEQLQRVGAWSHEHGLKVHMDGARLFNAVVATGYSAKDICAPMDTISICFSKGLGCPVGSVLAGSTEEIRQARRSRKLLGGAMRQTGVVAAAAIYAMENNVERLQDDHDNAQALSQALSEIDGIVINPEDIETNLVFFEVEPELGFAQQLQAKLAENGLLVGASGSHRLRACTHLDVDRDDTMRAAEIVRQSMAEGFSQMTGSATGPYARG